MIHIKHCKGSYQIKFYSYTTCACVHRYYWSSGKNDPIINVYKDPPSKPKLLNSYIYKFSYIFNIIE